MKKPSTKNRMARLLSVTFSMALSFSTLAQTSIYDDALSSGTIWHSNGAEIANPLNNSDNSSSTVIANTGAGAWEETQIFPDTYTISSGDKLYISFYNPNGATGWQLKISLSTTGADATIGDFNHITGAAITWIESVVDLSAYAGEDMSKITIYPVGGEAKSISYDNIYIQTSSDKEVFRETGKSNSFYSDGGIITNPSPDAINYSESAIINNGTAGWKDTQWFTNYTIDATDRLYISFYNPNDASQWQLRMDLSTTGAFTQINGEDYDHDSNTASGWVEVSVGLSAYNGEEVTKIQLYSSAGEAKSIYFDNVYFSTASQQSNNWVGTSSTDWSASGNWEGSFVPSSSSNVTINSALNSPQISGDVVLNNLKLDADLAVNSGSLTINGDMNGSANLVVESGASLLTTDGNTVNNVTIKRNTRYTGGKYSFVGSPVEASGSITGSDLGSTTYYYDESEAYSVQGGDRWKGANTVSLNPGTGYAQAFQKELVFNGAPNDGDVVVTGLTYTSGTAGEQGWNLLSNPYPAAIDVTEFLTENSTVIENAVYLWDDGGSQSGTSSNSDYLSVNALGTVGGPNSGSFNGYIGSAQGFFVKLKAEGTADVTFTEDMRETGSNADLNFFRQTEAKTTSIRLSLTSKDGNLYNELLIGYNHDATTRVDALYDAPKLISNESLQFYSFIEDNKYAIQGLPNQDGVQTELGFDLGASSEISFSVEEMIGLEDGMSFFLTDKLTGEIYDLNEMSGFTFQSQIGTNQNRFALSYRSVSVLSTEALDLIPTYSHFNNVLTIDFGQELIVEGFVIYDISGSIISENHSSNVSVQSIDLNVASEGLRVVKIVTSQGTFIRKFIF